MVDKEKKRGNGTELVKAGWVRMAVGMDVDVAANGSLEKWCESVELECVWKRVFVAVFFAHNGVLKLGMTDFSMWES